VLHRFSAYRRQKKQRRRRDDGRHNSVGLDHGGRQFRDQALCVPLFTVIGTPEIAQDLQARCNRNEALDRSLAKPRRGADDP